MKSQRILGIFSVAILLIAVTALVFSRQSVRLAVLNFLEVSSGEYTIRLSTDDVSRETLIGRTQILMEQTVEMKKKTIENQEKIALIQARKQAENQRAEIFIEAWDATVTGYLRVKKEACPIWESCKAVDAAYFVVTGEVPEKLSQYRYWQKNTDSEVEIGCLESRRIRFLSYDNMKSRQYEFLTGEDFRLLKGSSPDHEVKLSLT